MPKLADFVDGIEVDKVRNTAEIFSFMVKFVFKLWTLETVLDLLYGRNRLKSKEKQGSEDERRKCGRHTHRGGNCETFNFFLEREIN